jgi:hypothetical protein
VRTLENIALLGLAALLIVVVAQWLRTTKFRPPDV